MSEDTSAPVKSSSRATWTADSDRILLEVFVDQKALGFQTDNGGWHPDAYVAASNKLKASGYNVNSNSCKTRWNTLKRDFRDVKFIRESCSGFGWDEARKMATASENVWADLIKKKPKLSKWQRKCFPFYEEVESLLENQVATGATAFYPGISSNNSSDSSEGQLSGNDGGEDEDDQRLDESQTTTFRATTPSPPTPAPARYSVAPTSGSSSLSTALKRCFAASPDGSEHPAKRTRTHGWKPTQSDAGFEMAEALRDLARVTAGDNVDSSALSPARRQRAIQCIEDDAELSDEEMTEAFKLVRRQTTVGDTYLAIHDKARHTHFIQAEIEADRDSSFRL